MSLSVQAADVPFQFRESQLLPGNLSAMKPICRCFMNHSHGIFYAERLKYRWDMILFPHLRLNIAVSAVFHHFPSFGGIDCSPYVTPKLTA